MKTKYDHYFNFFAICKDFNTQNHEVEVKFHALVQINNSNVCKSECDENTNSTSNSNNNRSLISLNCSSLFNSNSNSNQFLKENEELQKKKYGTEQSTNSHCEGGGCVKVRIKQTVK